MAKNAFKWLVISVIIAGFNACVLGTGDRCQGRLHICADCAPCHGADGKGNGFLSTVLKMPPADLITLTRRNDGIFPIAAVNEIMMGER